MTFNVLLISLATLASVQALSSSATQLLLHERFARFKIEHKKVYTTNEHDKRLAIFETNLERASSLNSELEKLGHDQVHGITKFSDMEDHEFSFYLGVDANLKAPKMPVHSAPIHNRTLSGSFNWADRNMITEVKDQMQCGSCWAFSATETIESAWARHGHPLTEFAPQQLVSCDKADAGCNGGLPGNAFDFVIAAGGLATSESYPYTSGAGSSGTCVTTPVTSGTVSTWGYSQDSCQGFRSCTEDSAQVAANLHKYGPMSIAVDASRWNLYRGGVLKASSCDSSPRKMDHAVQLVGYNADAEVPYWIVRNSWGVTGWGEEGFIFLAMGGNTCGLINLAAQVTSI